MARLEGSSTRVAGVGDSLDVRLHMFLDVTFGLLRQSTNVAGPPTISVLHHGLDLLGDMFSVHHGLFGGRGSDRILDQDRVGLLLRRTEHLRLHDHPVGGQFVGGVELFRPL